MLNQYRRAEDHYGTDGADRGYAGQFVGFRVDHDLPG